MSHLGFWILAPAEVKGWLVSFSFRASVSELTLKRMPSLPVSRMWQQWIRRSSNAVVILASPWTVLHSLNLWLVVMTTLFWSQNLLSRWSSSAPPEAVPTVNRMWLANQPLLGDTFGQSQIFSG